MIDMSRTKRSIFSIRIYTTVSGNGALSFLNDLLRSHRQAKSSRWRHRLDLVLSINLLHCMMLQILINNKSFVIDVSLLLYVNLLTL